MRHTRPLPSAEYLRELFDYNPLTGELVWRVNKPRARVGWVAGGRTPQGYVRINIDGVKYLAHRLVWAWHYGEDPKAVIHHERADKRNTIQDLRDVSQRENSSIERTERSGLPVGIYLYKRTGRYMARIWAQGIDHFLGYFDTVQDASDAYQRALARVEQGLPPQAVEKDYYYYYGTSWDKKRGKWQARIRVDGRRLFLGYFVDHDDAVRARIAAEIQYFGKALLRKEKP